MMSPLLLAREVHDEICDSRSFVSECDYLICPKCKYYVKAEAAAGQVEIRVYKNELASRLGSK
jgi:hypothetical protein